MEINLGAFLGSFVLGTVLAIVVGVIIVIILIKKAKKKVCDSHPWLAKVGGWLIGSSCDDNGGLLGTGTTAVEYDNSLEPKTVETPHIEGKTYGHIVPY